MRYFVLILALVVELGVLAGMFALLAGQSAASAEAVTLGTALTVFLVCLSWNLQVLVHETGHLIAGLRAGLEFKTLAVGPVEASRVDGKIRWHLSNRSLIAGFVLMTPKGKPDLPRWMWMVAGGPIASLAFSGLLLAALYGAGGSLAQTNGLAMDVLRYSCYLSGPVLFATLVPYQLRTGHRTDMSTLLRLSRGGRERELALNQLILAREIFGGLRARDWTAEAIDRQLELAETTSDRSTAQLLAYYHAFDLGRIAEAQRHIRAGVMLVPDLAELNAIRSAVNLEGAVMAAWVDDDPVEATQLVQAASDKIETHAFLRHLAQASIAGARGQLPEALALLDRAALELGKLARRSHGNLDFDYERISAMRSAFQSGIGSAAAEMAHLDTDNRFAQALALYKSLHPPVEASK